MKFRSIHFIIVFALIALLGTQAFAAEVDTKEATTSAINPDTMGVSEALTFFGGINLRLYSKYYEGGNSPWAVYSKMCATLGVTADLGTVFMGLTLMTGNSEDYTPTYGDARDNLVEFNFMNDFNTYFKEAYAIWHLTDKAYLALGRSPWMIDKAKKFYVHRTGLTFDGGLRLDTLGLFPVIYDQDGTYATLSLTFSYLGKYLDPSTTLPYDPGYRHFLLVGAQPKIHMQPQNMDVMFGGGFWTITHPSDLQAAGGASKPWGEDVFGNDKNANLLLLEFFGTLSVEQTKVFGHIIMNMGTEEQGFGALFGFTDGATKKTGDMQFGITLYYLESYAWLDSLVDTTMGSGYKGVQVSFDYVFHQNMIFYALCTFKNHIGDEDSATGQIYLKTGIKVNFRLKPKK